MFCGICDSMDAASKKSKFNIVPKFRCPNNFLNPVATASKPVVTTASKPVVATSNSSIEASNQKYNNTSHHTKEKEKAKSIFSSKAGKKF